MLRLLAVGCLLAAASALRLGVPAKSLSHGARRLVQRRPLGASMKAELSRLIERRDLTAEETERIWTAMLSDSDPVVMGALLVLLRAKGETPQEVAGMVRAMKAVCRPVSYPGKLLDIVGTGGDGADTINISTAAVVLSAACGCKVAKAGNRSVSSKCGSADVLERLGVRIELSPGQVAKTIDDCGIGFMFAPTHHPAMKAVAPVRKQLGVRTAFNILGPLTNAAGAQHVLLGVFDAGLVELMGSTLQELGQVEHGVIVHGCGLDEISPLGASSIFELRNVAPPGAPKRYETKHYTLDPLDLGVARCSLADLRGGEPEENARAFREVLTGGPHNDGKRDAVVLNAGMGCYVYGLTDSIEAGVRLARTTLESGKALQTLEKWIASSQANAELDI